LDIITFITGLIYGKINCLFIAFLKLIISFDN
jgi:hypothetical protein